MIKFSDVKLYLKGTATAILIEKATGDIRYYSDKFQTANYQTSVTMGEIRAGLGNGIAAILPSDAAVNVNFTAADFSLAAKAMQVGAARTFGAPVMTCQTVTAAGADLTIDVADGVPVTALGMSKVICWVQEVGGKSLIATDGTAYEIDGTGAISGFVATPGTEYKVTYFVTRANAEVATITTAMDPFVGYFMSAMAVYANAGGAANEGTRAGTLYAIVPSLKLGADAGVVGDQTTNDTTSLTGQALAFDEDTVSAECDDCAGAGNVLAYYVYVPCDTTTGIEGIVAALGGVVTVGVGETARLNPATVMDGKLSRSVPAADFTYTSADTGIATVDGTGTITGVATGSTEITVAYTVGAQTFTDIVNVDVT